MSNFLIKGHNAILRADAVHDWNNVASNLTAQNKSGLIVYPKGASWQKVEDSTAAMVKKMDDLTGLVLHRGVSYYKSLNQPNTKSL